MNRQSIDAASGHRDADPRGTPASDSRSGSNPNDALESAERELRDGPAPLGEDGGDPAPSRSGEP